MHKLCALTALQIGVLLQSGVIYGDIKFISLSELREHPSVCVAEVICKSDEQLSSLQADDCVAIAVPLGSNVYGAVHLEEEAVLLTERFTV